jgi:hypothetical protein
VARCINREKTKNLMWFDLEYTIDLCPWASTKGKDTINGDYKDYLFYTQILNPKHLNPHCH